MIKKILISQPQPSSEKSPYFDIIRKYNLEAVFHPFIKVVPVTGREYLDQKVNVRDYTAVVFASKHAIDNYFHICELDRFKVPDDMKYFGISEKVMLYIQKHVTYRKRKVFFSPTGKWADLLPSMVKHKTEKYLIAQGDHHNDELTSLMDSKKLTYKEFTVYRTVANDFTDGTSLSDFDAVVLFTPSGVQSLVQNFPDWEQGDTKLICFGDTTCRATEGTNLRIDYAPSKEKVVSVVAALDAFLAEQNK